jgi:hypothetical protein
MRRAAGIARRLPATLALGGLLLAVMLATVLHAPPHSVLVLRLGVSWRDLQHLRLWRVATSSLVQDDTGLVWPIIALLPALAAAELRFGSAPTVAAYVLVDVVSTVPVLAVLALAGAAGLRGAQRLADLPSIGSSAGLIGVLAAAIAALRGRRRRLAAAALATGLAAALAFDWELASLQHTIAALAGAAAGLWLARRRPATEPARYA